MNREMYKTFLKQILFNKKYNLRMINNFNLLMKIHQTRKIRLRFKDNKLFYNRKLSKHNKKI
jgi:hypothetical protein